MGVYTSAVYILAINKHRPLKVVFLAVSLNALPLHGSVLGEKIRVGWGSWSA